MPVPPPVISMRLPSIFMAAVYAAAAKPRARRERLDRSAAGDGRPASLELLLVEVLTDEDQA